ncbi:MAG TPA: N-acetyltransferase [Rhizomicrobium sp.]
MEIRGETATDFPAVRRLLIEAFPTDAEADLVDRLRQGGSSIVSLVAIIGSQLAGYVLFSRMERPDNSLGLAPVAVQASWRRRGVAASLIREGLSRAGADGWARIFVLGDPDYYRRFGFNASLAEGYISPYAGPHLMALNLRADIPAERKGELRYAPAFAALV